MGTSSAALHTGSDFGRYGVSGRSLWLDINWQDHLRWASVDGDAVSYVELGDGPVLVFVHGLSGSWRNWLENIVPFSATHRVIALDLPGFGSSPMPSTPISIQRYAVIVDRLLSDLGIDTATLVGNSMGGLISLETTLRYPDRVSKLVLVSPAGLSTAGLIRPTVLTQLKRVEPGLARATSATGRRAPKLVGRPKLRRAMLAGVASNAELLTPEITEEQLKGSGAPGFMPALESILQHPIRDRVGQVACPTLLIWGTQDRLITVRDADTFEKLIPNVHTVRYPATGHVAMLERPDRFYADVVTFLTA